MKTKEQPLKIELPPKRNKALGIYILSITLIMVTYTAVTVTQYL